MEDFKLILYILAIIAYFIYNAWRKAFNTPDQETPPPVKRENPQRERSSPLPLPNPIPTSQPQARQQRPAVPATSFEDILREMQSKMERAKEQHRPTVEKPKPEPKPQPMIVPTYQPVAKEWEPKRALSLENPDYIKQYNRSREERLATAEAQQEAKKLERRAIPNVYGELLRNPQSVRQAFILSEVFNRKQY